jgi:hypothetical protein
MENIFHFNQSNINHTEKFPNKFVYFNFTFKVQHFCSVMALDSKPEEMFDKVLAPVESQITAKEETEMIAKEKLEEMVKEENVIFLISDKQVRKEESRKKKIHVCPHKYCEQSFSRPCSLASHIRSHTSKVGTRDHLSCYHTDFQQVWFLNCLH